MNDLQIFNNPEFGEVRAVELDGEPWFVGKDVAMALGYKDTDQALRKHVDDEDKLTRRFDGSGQNREMTIINESGVYSLIFSSKLPKAKEFKRWVTSEVLPSIRKTGTYLAPEAKKEMEDIVYSILEDFDTRLSALEGQRPALPARLTALPAGMAVQEQVPGAAFRKRWMRTVSEKLSLLQVRFDMTHNELLHQLYKILEKENDVVLDEEKLRVMEEHGLDECSVLTAIFYSPDLRDALQGTIDYNLAPENRGW